MAKPSSEPARRAPQTHRGKSTHTRLLKGAEQAFYTFGYPGTSVAQICREARVANGTFYQYFSDKFDAFAEIVRALSRHLHRELQQAAQSSAYPKEQLICVNRAYFEVVALKVRAYQIFRESEFVDLKLSQGFYRPAVALYERIIQCAVDQGQFCSLSPQLTAWAMLGLQEFVATRWLVWEKAPAQRRPQSQLSCLIESTQKFLLHGLGCPFKGLTAPPRARPSVRGNAEKPVGTRKALLQAAEQRFGRRGFHATQISDITRQAGVAQGTFYLYFPSKVALFAQLVREINQNLIDEIRQATAGLAHRRDVEQAGFNAFFRFIRRHTLAYRIVREAEFVDEEAGQGYYRRIAAGYVKGLRQAMKRNHIRTCSCEPLAYGLMGIGHLVGLKWLVWDGLEALPAPALNELMRFICLGMENTA